VEVGAFWMGARLVGRTELRRTAREVFWMDGMGWLFFVVFDSWDFAIFSLGWFYFGLVSG